MVFEIKSIKNPAKKTIKTTKNHKKTIKKYARLTSVFSL